MAKLQAVIFDLNGTMVDDGPFTTGPGGLMPKNWGLRFPLKNLKTICGAKTMRPF